MPPVWAAAAAKPVEPGEFLSGTAIKWVEMKADEAPASAISAKRPGDRTAAALLMGATVRRSVPQGELITQDDVLYPGNPGFLAAVLSPGKRAVSIPTSAVSSNSGLVSAGDWVDVILTLKRETAEAMADQQDKTSGMTKLAAQTILTNVRVLALNNSTESIAPQPETAPQKTDAKKTASTAGVSPSSLNPIWSHRPPQAVRGRAVSKAVRTEAARAAPPAVSRVRSSISSKLKFLSR